MPDLRLRPLWLGIGWLMIAAISVGSLMPAGDAPAVANDKVLHFGAYFVLTLWFCGIYDKRSRYPFIALRVTGLGVLLDAAQGLTATRQFDLFDVGANGFGAATALVLAAVCLGGWCRAVEHWLGIATERG